MRGRVCDAPRRPPGGCWGSPRRRRRRRRRRHAEHPPPPRRSTRRRAPHDLCDHPPRPPPSPCTATDDPPAWPRPPGHFPPLQELDMLTTWMAPLGGLPGVGVVVLAVGLGVLGLISYCRAGAARE